MIKKRIKILEDEKRKEEIEKLEKEVEDVFYLFEELREDIKKDEENLNLISEAIIEDKKEIENSKKEIEVVHQHYLKTISKTLVGGGIGSLMFIYNPFLGIGTTVAGLAAGYFLSKVKD